MLASELARLTNLPLYRLDDLYWQPGWQRPDPADFAERLGAVVAQERWILEGNHASTLEYRLARADGVVLLDLPPWRCLFSVAYRGLQRNSGDLSTLPERVRKQAAPSGHRPAIDWRFVRKVAGFRAIVLAPMVRTIAQKRPEIRMLRLSERTSARTVIDRLGIREG